MSRSRKKTPIFKDHEKRPNRPMKAFANKKVRHTKDIPSGSSYKKIFNSWDISDYFFYCTKKEAIQWWEDEVYEATRQGISPDEYGWHKEYLSLDEFLNKYWARYYLRK